MEALSRAKQLDEIYAYTSVLTTGRTTQHPTKVLFHVRQILLNVVQQDIRMYQFAFTDAFLIKRAHFHVLLFEFFQEFF